LFTAQFSPISVFPLPEGAHTKNNFRKNSPFLTVYKTEDKDKADYYDYISRKNGFRVERSMINKLYILKIYGDIQKEVDEFVIQLENDLIINPYD
jgi:hypothetical protein